MRTRAPGAPIHQWCLGWLERGRIRIPDPADEYMLNRYLARAYHIFLLGARAATSHKMSVVNLLYLIKNDTPGLKPQNDTQPI